MCGSYLKLNWYSWNTLCTGQLCHTNWRKVGFTTFALIIFMNIFKANTHISSVFRPGTKHSFCKQHHVLKTSVTIAEICRQTVQLGGGKLHTLLFSSNIAAYIYSLQIKLDSLGLYIHINHALKLTL